jgi:hypothetical protein
MKFNLILKNFKSIPGLKLIAWGILLVAPAPVARFLHMSRHRMWRDRRFHAGRLALTASRHCMRRDGP